MEEGAKIVASVLFFSPLPLGLRSTAEMTPVGTLSRCGARFFGAPAVSLRSTTGFALGNLRLSRRSENDKKADIIVGLPGRYCCFARY